MTAPFDLALAVLEREVGGDAAARILRTEVRDDGGLVLTLETPAGFRWFECEGEQLRELRPGDEKRVPAARELSALCDRGEADLLSWRPGRRMVARLNARYGAHVVKAYRRGRAVKSARLHAALHAALSATPKGGVQSGFRLPRVLHADESEECVAFELLRGHELRFDDLGVFQRVGQALRRMQGSAPDTRLEVHGRAEELAQLDRHARRFVLAAGSLPPGWHEARALLDEVALEPAASHVVAHRDLHDGQLLVEGRTVALLDLDLACRAEPELDFANLAVHTRLAGWLGLRGADDRSALSAVRALREGFGVLEERSERFYSTASALRLALVHGLRPRARLAIEPLVDVARESAAEMRRA
ncbi:MAG: hypothetical protein NTY35_01745 [Planctomycetota bacterium]|nr:hypothetical protein [Planctomycetota bacterium]